MFFKNIYLIIIITTVYYISYIGGNLYLENSVLPIYFILYPMAFFKQFGLPFFTSKYPFIYLFLYQIILYYMYVFLKNKIYFVLCIYGILGCLIFYEKKIYYWERPINKSYESYLNNNTYIFPEGMFYINSQTDIEELISIAIKEGKKIIGGISWNELKEKRIIGKTGLITIYSCGYYYIREKNHQLGFAETTSKSKNINKQKNRILICSEFFLMPIEKQQKINIDFIIASVKWTEIKYNRIYYHIMNAIYCLFEFY